MGIWLCKERKNLAVRFCAAVQSRSLLPNCFILHSTITAKLILQQRSEWRYCVVAPCWLEMATQLVG